MESDELADQVVRGGMVVDAGVASRATSAKAKAPPRGPWLLHVYVVALAIGSTIVVLVALQRESSLLQSVYPWLGLTALFAAAEYAAVLFHDSKFRFGLSASEAILMPMLVGLSFTQVVLGAATGMAIARAASGSRSISKEVFNVSQFALAAAAAAALWAVSNDNATALSIRDIGAAVASVALFVLLTHVLFSLAMAAAKRVPLISGLKEFGFPEVASLGGSLLVGVFFTTAFVAAPWTVLLFPLALAALSFGYRALVRQAGENARLSNLYAAGHALSTTPDLASALPAFLRSVAQAVSSTGARAVVEVGGRLLWSGVEGDSTIADLAPLDDETRRMHERICNAGENRNSFDASDPEDLIAVPIEGASGIRGSIVAYGRKGADGFGTSERSMLGALGKELALALEAHAQFHEAARERERFELLVDAVQDYAIYMVDRDGYVASWNAGAERILGYAQSEILGQHISRFYPPEASPTTWEQDLHAAEDGKWEREGARVRKDGTRFLAHITKNPVRDGEGRLRGFATVVRDVTELVQAQQDKETLETQLHQAQKLETVGRLAGGIAHDFNNLLGVILNYSTFVIDELEADSELREDVNEIRGAAERASSLTRQLLIFSRREVPDPTVLDLNEVIADFARLLQRSLGEDVLLEIDLNGNVPLVKADAGQLEQVLMNLAVNARDAMQGGGTLTITTHREGDGSLLTVSDTGSGMSASVREKVFEPFFTTKPKGIGTGLGLSTVHGIVTQAGGRIEIDTREGMGTTVRIHLPGTTEEPAEKPRPEERRTPSGEQTILVVEDQDAVRAMTARILREQGYSVVEASGGDEALAAIGDQRVAPDLLLSDVVMPHMSGIDLGDKVTRLHPGTKVLYMSGYSNEVVSARNLGRDDLPLIAKPFDAGQLLCRVRDVLDG